MIILGIETSCDETAAAVVEKNEDKINVLSNVVASSQDMHAKSGGIIPEVAAREQVKSVIPVIKQSLADANVSSEDLHAIAVTVGPGLIGSLLVGVETAKTLAMLWDKPIVPINHLHGHIYSCFVEHAPEFPALALIVSGGHTDFVYMKGHGEFEWLGGTRDDAAGEAFDKTARIIGLGYPGGPAISKASDKYLENNPNKKLDLFPRPMTDQDNLDMSFSGLKTSVNNYLKSSENKNTDEIAAEIEEAIIDTLIKKSSLAIKKYRPKSFLLAGGVSANKRLREKLDLALQSITESTKFYVSPLKYTGDNATMIATTGLYLFQPIDWKEVKATPSLHF